MESSKIYSDGSPFGIYYDTEAEEVSFWGDYNDTQTILTVAFVVTLFIAVLIGIIIGALQYRFALDYEQTLYVKQMLEKRVGNLGTYDDAAKELLYTDITAFNNSLREIKWLSSNPLVSWFNNWRIASMDYIIV